jgi:hypothetical protein
LPQRSDLSAGGWVFTASNGVMRVRHDTGNSIQIVGSGSVAVGPTISSLSQTYGGVNVPYTASLGAEGGTPPYKWSVINDSMPPGLSLDALTGVLSGAPLSSGTFNLGVLLTDSGNPAATASKSFSVTITNTPGTTFGNTSDGSSSDTVWDNGAWINISRFRAVSNALVSEIRAKVKSVPGKYQCAVYADTGSLPGRLLSGSAVVTNPISGWNMFPLSRTLTLTNDQFYWLAIWSDDPAGGVYYAGNAGSLRWAQYDFGAWPDPILTSGGNSLEYCIYATGTNAVSPPQPVLLSISTSEILGGVLNVTGRGAAFGRSALEYSETLTSPFWLELTNVTADAAGVFQIIGLVPTNASSRFYRVRSY